jgi:hypothetical protein
MDILSRIRLTSYTFPQINEDFYFQVCKPQNLQLNTTKYHIPPTTMSSDKSPAALQATEEDIQLLLAAQCHLGTKNCDKTMEPYVFKRRADGE